MVIGYITSAYGRAGDTYVRNEVHQLRKLGHTVHTFSVRCPEATQNVDPVVSQERLATYYLLGGKSMQLLVATLLTMALRPHRFLAAAKLVSTIGPKGIRARIWQMAYLIEACLLARVIGQRGIEHLHDHIGESSGTVAMVAALLAGIPFSMTLHGPSIFYAPEYWGLTVKIERAAFVVCISYFCRSQCMAFSSFQFWDKLKVIHCGVGESFLAENPSPVRDVPRFICIGRLSEEKGQLLLVDATATLVKEGRALEVYLIGDGPMRSAIESLARQHGIEKNIKITGWQSTVAVREHLLASRALVSSSFAEGLPGVFMEAFALARPVISTQVAGVSELVEQGVNGWLVSAGSPEFLTDAMCAALQCSAEELTRMGQAGRERILLQHNGAVEAQKLSECFRSSIAANKNTATSV